MQSQALLDTARSIQSIRKHLRHINHVVIPSSRRLIEQSRERVSDSIGRQLESTQRVLDPDASRD